MNKRRNGWFLLPLFSLFLLAACQATTPAPTPTLVIPTALVPAELPADGNPNATLPPPVTITPVPVLPTSTPAELAAPDPTMTSPPAAAGITYRVAFVVEDDVLNVRRGAGVDNEIVGTLAPDAADVRVTGVGEIVSGSTWVPVSDGSVSGWVNSRFLAEKRADADFCGNEGVFSLLNDLKTALSQKDDALLAALIHPERGLRIHYHWWNPEVLINGGERSALFSGNRAYDWGVQDGSGLPIAGTFASEIAPLLQEDLLRAEQTACNQILAGGTAGLVQLPEGYDAVDYYSFYRPAADEGGFDWGTWVAGVEYWNGRFYLSYLVHYDWEI